MEDAMLSQTVLASEDLRLGVTSTELDKTSERRALVKAKQKSFEDITAMS